jgi:hypothetical protein
VRLRKTGETELPSPELSDWSGDAVLSNVIVITYWRTSLARCPLPWRHGTRDSTRALRTR